MKVESTGFLLINCMWISHTQETTVLLIPKIQETLCISHKLLTPYETQLSPLPRQCGCLTTSFVNTIITCEKVFCRQERTDRHLHTLPNCAEFSFDYLVGLCLVSLSLPKSVKGITTSLQVTFFFSPLLFLSSLMLDNDSFLFLPPCPRSLLYPLPAPQLVTILLPGVVTHTFVSTPLKSSGVLRGHHSSPLTIVILDMGVLRGTPESPDFQAVLFFSHCEAADLFPLIRIGHTPPQKKYNYPHLLPRGIMRSPNQPGFNLIFKKNFFEHYGVQKFLGQGWKLHHSRDNIRSFDS